MSHFHRQEMASGWLAEGVLAPVAGVSPSLPWAPRLALSFELQCCDRSLSHPPFIERLLYAEHCGPSGVTAGSGDSPCPPVLSLYT